MYTHLISSCSSFNTINIEIKLWLRSTNDYKIFPAYDKFTTSRSSIIRTSDVKHMSLRWALRCLTLSMAVLRATCLNTCIVRLLINNGNLICMIDSLRILRRYDHKCISSAVAILIHVSARRCHRLRLLLVMLLLLQLILILLLGLVSDQLFWCFRVVLNTHVVQGFTSFS